MTDVGGPEYTMEVVGRAVFLLLQIHFEAVRRSFGCVLTKMYRMYHLKRNLKTGMHYCIKNEARSRSTPCDGLSQPHP